MGFADEEKNLGTLVWAFSQGPQGLAACAGMAVVWLSSRSKGEDFKVENGKLKDEELRNQIEKIQNFYAQALQNDENRDTVKAYGKALAQVSLYKVKNTIVKGPPNAGKIAEYITDGGLFIVSLAYISSYISSFYYESKSHAFALDIQSKKSYRFMDANVGHYQASNQDKFVQLLGRLFSKGSYSSSYTTRTLIIKVK